MSGMWAGCLQFMVTYTTPIQNICTLSLSYCAYLFPTQSHTSRQTKKIMKQTYKSWKHSSLASSRKISISDFQFLRSFASNVMLIPLAAAAV